MKVYDSIEDANKAVMKLSERVHSKATPIITNELLKDSNNLAPIQTGQLKNSGVSESDLKEGVIQWTTSYAKKVWERNRTGVPKWGIAAFDKNVDKYQRIYKSIFNEEK